MSKILCKALLVIFIFSPVSYVMAQDDYGYDDYDYDDYDDEEGFSDVWGDASTSTNSNSDFRWLGFSLAAKAGVQLDLMDSFHAGGDFSIKGMFDLSYFYLSLGAGWSSHWSRVGQARGEASVDRPGHPFTEGFYTNFGGGIVVPQVGLRIGGGIQMTMQMLMHSMLIDYSDGIAPYVEISYEQEITNGVYWSIGLNTVITAVKFSHELPDDGSNAVIDLSFGLTFYLA